MGKEEVVPLPVLGSLQLASSVEFAEGLREGRGFALSKWTISVVQEWGIKNGMSWYVQPPQEGGQFRDGRILARGVCFKVTQVTFVHNGTRAVCSAEG